MTIDAFVSYARSDAASVDRICAAFQQAGVALWWDAMLAPDDDFDAQIQRAIGEAKVVVGVLSPASLSSDWVRWELSQAIVNGLHVIPLLIDGTQPKQLPPPLNLVKPIVLQDTSPEYLRASAQQVRRTVAALTRRLDRRTTANQDARRRLVQAAAATANAARKIGSPRGSTPGYSQRARVPHIASDGLAILLEDLGVSLAITSPDAGRLYLVGCCADHRASISETRLDSPTGCCTHQTGFAVATRRAIVAMQNVLSVGQRYEDRYSHCFVARTSHFLGELATHDLAASANKLLFVTSRYSCVAELSQTHSFRMVWKPAFVSEIVPEDRCHLNGIAMHADQLAFATAFAESDSLDGWRDRVRCGGIVIDTQSNKIVCRGLNMPHSPRFHDGRLWLLNAGTGELGALRFRRNGESEFEPVTALPGFARGLALEGNFAFVGVSRPRYNDARASGFGRLSDRDEGGIRAGTVVIDLQSGSQAGKCG